MKRASRLISVGASVALLWVAQSCNFSAGLKTNTGPSGASGAGATAGVGAAGTTGAAGAIAMTGTAGTGEVDAAALPPPPPAAACTNLACQQSTCTSGSCTVTCPNGGRTTISGKVYDPAGKVPLYNITVYVPNAALSPFTDGPHCDPCDLKTGTSLLSGQPIVVTKTDESGTFHLGMVGESDVPAGTMIPLVMQDGKWQREIMVPTVTACMDTKLTDPNVTRLPQTQAEGHIPKIALTTGGSDAMECLLRKIGIADTEFTPETAMGRVNLYAGGGGGSAAYGIPPNGTVALNNGAMFTPADPWWDSYDNISKYDIILHSCDGSAYAPGQDPAVPKSMAARTALQMFADNGGRVFASHWHAYWFEEGTPAFMSIATFEHDEALPNPYEATIDQTFDKGKSLATWMFDPSVMGSTTLGIVNIAQDASMRLIKSAAGGKISQQWIYASTLAPPSVQFLSATTPIPGGTCGRAVISDLHVSAGAGVGNTDIPKMPFPSGCVTTSLSPQEKVLEFMLFDIASCVQPIVQ